MANNIENEQENIIVDGPDYAGVVRSVFMYRVFALLYCMYLYVYRIFSNRAHTGL